jgi:hypothetical protein
MCGPRTVLALNGLGLIATLADGEDVEQEEIVFGRGGVEDDVLEVQLAMYISN